jgi:hypothetical protein
VTADQVGESVFLCKWPLKMKVNFSPSSEPIYQKHSTIANFSFSIFLLSSQIYLSEVPDKLK